MSLLSNWRDRRKSLGRSSGRPLWYLIGVLIIVVIFMYYLGNLEKSLLK